MFLEINERDFYFIKKDLMWLECSLGFITDCVDCVYILPFTTYSDIYLTDITLPAKGMELLSSTLKCDEHFFITIKQNGNINLNFKCKFAEKEGEIKLPTGDYFFTWLKFIGVKS
jgi:hypothetical protein